LKKETKKRREGKKVEVFWRRRKCDGEEE